jgi:hypothetical protein
MIDIPDSAVEAALVGFYGDAATAFIGDKEGCKKKILAAIQAALNDMLGEPVAYVELGQFTLASAFEWDTFVEKAEPTDVPLYAIKQGASRG